MSDWFGIIYREVLPQGVLLQEEQEEDGGKVAPLPAAPFNERAAGASTPRLAGRRQQQRPGPRRPSSSTFTRMPYAEAIFDAERVVCADEGVGGECE